MNIEDELDILGKDSVVASQEIKSLGKKEKNELLNAIIEKLKNDKDQILEANKLEIIAPVRINPVNNKRIIFKNNQL